MPPLAHMDFLTLRFDDDELETEIRRSQIQSCRHLLNLFPVLIFLFLELSGYSRNWLQLGSVAGGLLFTHLITHHWQFEQSFGWLRVGLVNPKQWHLYTGWCWSIFWSIDLVIWRYLIQTGGFSRLPPDLVDISIGEYMKRVTGACGLWMVAPLIPHILHIGFAHRVFVDVLIIIVVISGSEVWQALLLALILGEACGYVVEHNLRDSFLQRLQSFERVQQEKERAVYDMMMAQQHAARAASTRPNMHAHAVGGIEDPVLEERGGSWRDDVSLSADDNLSRVGGIEDIFPETAGSGGSNSEIVSLAHVANIEEPTATEIDEQFAPEDMVHPFTNEAATAARRRDGFGFIPHERD